MESPWYCRSSSVTVPFGKSPRRGTLLASASTENVYVEEIGRSTRKLEEVHSSLQA